MLRSVLLLLAGCASACALTSLFDAPAGEGEGEGEGEAEGEPAEGEGEGEGEDAPLPRPCDVIEVDGVAGGLAVSHAALIVRAPVLLRAAPGLVEVRALDDGLVAVVSQRVGDLVFGSGAGACSVHVAAPPGVHIEVAWNDDADVDLTLSRLQSGDLDESFCVAEAPELDGFSAIDVNVCGSGTCDYRGCESLGDDAGPVSLSKDEQSGPASESISFARPPPTKLLATAHAFGAAGPVLVTVRAWFDDVLIGEAQDVLNPEERGATLLIILGDEGICVADSDVAPPCGLGLADGCDDDDGCGAGLSCRDERCRAPTICDPACRDACLPDGSCAPCDDECADGCNPTTDRCVPRCSDPDDVDDGLNLGIGRTDNTLCPGDVDVFAIFGVAPFDIVRLQTQLGTVTFFDSQGVISEGESNAEATVRAAADGSADRIFVRLHNGTAELSALDASLVLTLDLLVDRCAADDEFEPDALAPRLGTTRADGILCPADDVDCVIVNSGAAGDRAFFLDAFAYDELCLVQGDGCAAEVDQRFWVNAGDSFELCARGLADPLRPGQEWHVRSETREIFCADDEDNTPEEVLDTGVLRGLRSNSLCGRESDFHAVALAVDVGAVVTLEPGDVVDPVLRCSEGTVTGLRVVLSPGAARTVFVEVQGTTATGSSRAVPYSLAVLDD
ncbi:MAG: hypothetical protein Q8O67_07445 [Deltaproteobacteria bacterium]|nr:hypothetical protein [Deltaproteobacteria bacterium]